MKNLSEHRHVHFIGIGGISMSALALEMLKNGAEVSGSDTVLSHITERLQKAGIKIFEGHAAENISGACLVVKNSAIKEDNPELAAARENNIEIIDRAALLGRIMSGYKRKIAVAGMHGKTTATGLTAAALSPLCPAVHIGGELNSQKSEKPKSAERGVFITEACEYCRNFLLLEPDIAVVLNIDKDHPDYFKSEEDIICAFNEFAGKITPDGTLLYNGDDKNCLKLSAKNRISFGTEENCDYRAVNIKSQKGRYHFDILKRGVFAARLKLNIFGRHQVYNALAAFAAGDLCGVPVDDMRKGIENFRGIKRRFELFPKKLSGADVVIDYAHHPREIAALLSAAREAEYQKIHCIFQPHTYSRTEALMEDFAVCFREADSLILMPVYAAREKPRGADSLALLSKIEKPHAVFIEDGLRVIEYLKTRAGEGDIVLITGAGNIVDICKYI